METDKQAGGRLKLASEIRKDVEVSIAIHDSSLVVERLGA